MRCLLAAAVVALVGCSTDTPSQNSPSDSSSPPKVYEVVRVVDPSVQLDGNLNEPIWEEANLVTDFVFPWRDRPAPPTAFRAISDGKTLYFAFDVEDEDVVVDDKTPGEKALIAEDRVEFYFAPDLDLEKYYSVEMDFQGRKLDYIARFHRKFDFDWEFPEIKTVGKRTPKGYTIEGAIPLSVFESLGLPSLESGNLRVGVFRPSSVTATGTLRSKTGSPGLILRLRKRTFTFPGRSECSKWSIRSFQAGSPRRTTPKRATLKKAVLRRKGLKRDPERSTEREPSVLGDGRGIAAFRPVV